MKKAADIVRDKEEGVLDRQADAVEARAAGSAGTVARVSTQVAALAG